MDLRSRIARKHGQHSRDQHPTQKRLAEAETPNPDEAQNQPQVLVLASIDLRSQYWRLVSARVSASLRKGVLGSCNRAASRYISSNGTRLQRVSGFLLMEHQTGPPLKG